MPLSIVVEHVEWSGRGPNSCVCVAMQYGEAFGCSSLGPAGFTVVIPPWRQRTDALRDVIQTDVLLPDFRYITGVLY